MKSWKLVVTLLAASICTGFSGCAMCCAPFDYDYGYTGGAWVRDNPSCGRVGSAFEPAGYQVDAGRPVETSTEPTPASPAGAEPVPDQYAPPAAAPPGQTNMTSTPRLRRVDEYLPQE
jgi:hypothetical protein